ncbi:hypothetical protein C0J52_14498 [Blattella germanica]|nr:hypothetical protein C0J52_14498 [Blattella germanica]
MSNLIMVLNRKYMQDHCLMSTNTNSLTTNTRLKMNRRYLIHAGPPDNLIVNTTRLPAHEYDRSSWFPPDENSCRVTMSHADHNPMFSSIGVILILGSTFSKPKKCLIDLNLPASITICYITSWDNYYLNPPLSSGICGKDIIKPTSTGSQSGSYLKSYTTILIKNHYHFPTQE